MPHDFAQFTPIDRVWIDTSTHGTVMMLSLSSPNYDLTQPVFVPLSNLQETVGFIKFVWVGGWEGKALLRADGITHDPPASDAQIRTITFTEMSQL